MDLLKGFVGPLNTSALKDTMKLVVIGGTVETARRVSATAWGSFVDSFFLTAHFSQEDYPYDWLMHWLSKQPAWGRSREFEITTRTAGKQGMTSTSNEEDLEDEDDDDDEQLVHGRRKKKVAFLPSLDTTHTIFYHGHWLRITRSKKTDTYHGSTQELKISVVARNNTILKKLVLQAKREYEADMEHRVHIFLADSYGSWRWNGARQKRPLSSIVLEPGVKDMLMADARDFLASEEWYADRGIPFRRGYLLHGVPGSGKTSLIHAVAGALGLDIYVISLSSKGMNDTTLTNLMGRVPSRCIVLLEDLDAAFTRSVSRDEKSTGLPLSATSTTSTTTPAATPAESDGNSLSLSGLLNSLDGVAASEGRILFATTNHIERLDPALSRPGRMDVWIDFKHASKWQAEGIFMNFFPCKTAADPSAIAEEELLQEDPKKRPPMATRRRTKMHAVPLLEQSELSDLAKQFAAAIPENELSVASLQGYLLKNKTRPREAVNEVTGWIEKERETRAKLKKEKEEREAKEKAEREEKEAKAKADKAEKATKATEETTVAEPVVKRRRAKPKSAVTHVETESVASSPSSSTVIVPSPNAATTTAAKSTTTDLTSSPSESVVAVSPPSTSMISSLNESTTETTSGEGESCSDEDTDATSEEEAAIIAAVDAVTSADASSSNKWVSVKAKPIST